MIPSTPALSATVILIRDGKHGLEVLLLQRNPNLVVHGGEWVFPGGTTDETDWAKSESQQPEVVTKFTAVRELHEETGLTLPPEALYPHSHWLTPKELRRRFTTWFYVAPVSPSDVIIVDQGEITDYRWLTPAKAIQKRQSGLITLPPPTFVTLTNMQPFATVNALLHQTTRQSLRHFAPRIAYHGQAVCSLYQGDVAYEDGDLTRSGQRHRLWFLSSGWQYENNLKK